MKTTFSRWSAMLWKHGISGINMTFIADCSPRVLCNTIESNQIRMRNNRREIVLWFAFNTRPWETSSELIVSNRYHSALSLIRGRKSNRVEPNHVPMIPTQEKAIWLTCHTLNAWFSVCLCSLSVALNFPPAEADNNRRDASKNRNLCCGTASGM